MTLAVNLCCYFHPKNVPPCFSHSHPQPIFLLFVKSEIQGLDAPGCNVNSSLLVSVLLPGEWWAQWPGFPSQLCTCPV